MFSSNVTLDKEFISLAQKSDDFIYDKGQGNLYTDIFPDDCVNQLREEHIRRAIRQPSAIYCGQHFPLQHVDHDISCCLAHTARHASPQSWAGNCKRLDSHLKKKVHDAPEKGLTPEQVLEAIEASGRSSSVAPSNEWERALTWLKVALLAVYDRCSFGDSPEEICRLENPRPFPRKHRRIVEDTIEATKALYQCSENPSTKKRTLLRPGQLSAVLLNVYCANTNTKLMIEMKTGEGKTFVCAVSAAIIAKRFGIAMILTSSGDRASDDKKSTDKFMEEYFKKKARLICEDDPNQSVKPGQTGFVAYGQVVDVQKEISWSTC